MPASRPTRVVASGRAPVSMALISMTMALTALGVDLLLPAFDDIREAFDLGEDSTQPALLITVYFLGLAAAQLIWGPFSDRFGRKPVLFAAIAVYCLGSLGSALAPSFETLVAARAFWGVGAAGTQLVSVAIIRDLYEGDRMAAYMSRVMAIFLIVPIIAPLMGAALLEIAPWRALFWVTMLLALALGLWASRAQETLTDERRRPLSYSAVGEAMRTTMTTRVTFTFTLIAVVQQGAFVTYLASSELVIDEVFDRGSQFAVIFAAVAVALGAASLTASRLVARWGGVAMARRGLVASVAVSTVMLAVSLIGDGRPNFFLFFGLLTVQLSLQIGIMPTLNSLALQPLGAIAGTAASVTGAMRIAGGGVLGAIVDRQLSDSVTPWAVTFIVTTVAALVLFRASGERGAPPNEVPHSSD